MCGHQPSSGFDVNRALSIQLRVQTRGNRRACAWPRIDTEPMAVAPDYQQLTVNGELFDVRYDLEQPGAYHFVWVTGPNPGYGFTSRFSSDDTRQPRQLLIDSIIRFLAQVDPQTRCIEES
jgi:hypothetical protein